MTKNIERRLAKEMQYAWERKTHPLAGRTPRYPTSGSLNVKGFVLRLGQDLRLNGKELEHLETRVNRELAQLGQAGYLRMIYHQESGLIYYYVTEAGYEWAKSIQH